MWRPCRDAIEARQREAVEIRQGEVEIRQGIGGGRADDGHGEQGHQDRRQSARSHQLCHLRWFICLCFYNRCFSHLRSLPVSPVASFFLAGDQQTKKAVAWTIQRRLWRDCPPKFT